MNKESVTFVFSVIIRLAFRAVRLGGLSFSFFTSSSSLNLHFLTCSSRILQKRIYE